MIGRESSSGVITNYWLFALFLSTHSEGVTPKKEILTCQTLFQENNALHRGHESGESEGSSRHINRAQQNSQQQQHKEKTSISSPKSVYSSDVVGSLVISERSES